ncbi:mannose-1-phosphate guanylyltransferase [Sinomicrobium sp. M5D2P17]
MQKVVHVILTGGVGSRLWPLSRKSMPKQYIRLFSEFSLLEQTILRNTAFADKLLIVGNMNNTALSEASVRRLDIKHAQTIAETAPRNTAAAIAFAAFASRSEDLLLVTPSDHAIDDDDLYQESINRAIHIAKQGYIVTFGIKPEKPETGYGYIEYSGENVLSFREKPDVETAREFLSKGSFLWNSGMFCFKAGLFLEELKLHATDVYQAAEMAWKHNKNGLPDKKLSLQIPSISVDYAVMEKSKKIKVIASHFRWSDLGSFESLYNFLKEKGHQPDAHGNMVIGTDKHTSFIGLSDVIFVNTPDANLILTKERSQDVKHLYTELEKNSSSLIE